MPTCATISVHDLKDRFDIYRHHDGYPEGEHGVIADVKNAIDMSWEFPGFEAGDFSAALIGIMKRGPSSVSLELFASNEIRDSLFDWFVIHVLQNTGGYYG